MKRYVLILLTMLLANRISAQEEDLKVNHLYFVLDSASFSTIRSSGQFAKWSSLDRGLPDFLPTDTGSTTLYMRGKSTYLEIMGPDNRFGEKEGAIGIGFSWDTPGKFSDDISKKIKNKGLPFKRSNAMWDFKGKDVLWYSAYYTDLKGGIATWYAFYNPEFLTRLYHKEYPFFTREAFLEKAFDDNKEIRDLSSIALECTAEDFHKLTRELHSLGITPVEKNGDAVTFDIDSIRITMTQIPNTKSRIKELRLKTKKGKKEDLELGKIKVRHQDNELIMMFN
ncbi:DUF5829 family protein [Chryseobacterium pennipullorum]|nr:DUF5829 family protein [Chryseobacterium pennipullorum]